MNVIANCEAGSNPEIMNNYKFRIMNLELKAKPLKEANMDNPLQAKRGSGKKEVKKLRS